MNFLISDTSLVLQVWRLITNYLFFGPVGFNFLFNMIFLYLLTF